MRRTFAACMAFMVLMTIVAVRFGYRHSLPDAPVQPIVDAAIADAPIDAAVVVDAAPASKKHPPKPKPKPTQTPVWTAPKPTPKPNPKPTPKPVIPTPVVPTPVIPPPVIPPPVRPRCTQPANPAGCPATEPNINHPCDIEGVHCVYGTSCCPPIYVCTDGAFEAWFSHCQ